MPFKLCASLVINPKLIRYLKGTVGVTCPNFLLIPRWRYSHSHGIGFYTHTHRITALQKRIPLSLPEDGSSDLPFMPPKDPASGEQYLPLCVYIIGPQSTGKTTLVNALSRAFNDKVPIIREIARKVMAEKGYSKIDVDSENKERRLSMQRDIFTAQVEAEMSLLSSSEGASFLSDRSAIDPLIYLLRYSGREELDRLTTTEMWQAVRDRYRDTSKSLVLLLLPVEQFLDDDDIRYVPKSLEDWHALAEDFRGFMTEEGIPFIGIGEECLEIEERVLFVLSKLLPSSKQW